jgi:hypothetical protein
LIFRVKFLKREIMGIDNEMCALGSCGRFPKMEIAPFGLAIWGNVCSLLAVMSSKKWQYLP